MRTLVTGAVRSGKTRVAEGLLTTGVTYIATGPVPDAADPEWQARVAGHQASRPAGWTTVETTDPATALAALTGPALLDCLGTWLTATLDDQDAWTAPRAAWSGPLHDRIQAVVHAWTDCPHDLVAVTNEVGWGLVSEYPAGRIFADELGRLNQVLAAASDRVLLVVAGRVLELPAPEDR